MCQKSDSERDEARAEVARLQKTLAKVQETLDSMAKKFAVLERDSEILVMEKKLTQKLKAEVAQLSDKKSQAESAIKEMKRKLNKTEGSVNDVTN